MVQFPKTGETKESEYFAGIALLPGKRIYSVRDVVRHRMHECPCAWAAGEANHTSVAV